MGSDFSVSMDLLLGLSERPRMSTISSVKYCWSLPWIRPQAAVERIRLSRLFCRQYNQVKEAIM